MTQARNARAIDGRPDNADRRAERIEEYLQDSLNRKTHCRPISAGAADLMHIRSKLMESIKAELDDGPGDPGRLPQGVFTCRQQPAAARPLHRVLRPVEP